MLFAMLAGGAPLLSERLTARGGPPIELRDPLSFYETSSYGPAAIEATAAHVGALGDRAPRSPRRRRPPPVRIRSSGHRADPGRGARDGAAEQRSDVRG